MDRYVITLQCADRPGLVAEVAGAVCAAGGNITRADQHTDVDSQFFCQRLEVEAPSLERLNQAVHGLTSNISDARTELVSQQRPGRIAVVVSSTGHCLYDLAARCITGDLDCEISVVVSNVQAQRQTAERFGLPFVWVPSPGPGATEPQRAAHDAQVMEALDSYGDVDAVVLARYMRVVGPAFIEAVGTARLINIHHSLLPAFVGADPYSRAHERGVKLIGATAHYVTAELDAGPIIAQSVASVSHRDSSEVLRRRGRDLEATTLASAVRAHLERRVFTYGNRTVVFE